MVEENIMQAFRLKFFKWHCVKLFKYYKLFNYLSEIISMEKYSKVNSRVEILNSKFERKSLLDL